MIINFCSTFKSLLKLDELAHINTLLEDDHKVFLNFRIKNENVLVEKFIRMNKTNEKVPIIQHIFKKNQDTYFVYNSCFSPEEDNEIYDYEFVININVFKFFIKNKNKISLEVKKNNIRINKENIFLRKKSNESNLFILDEDKSSSIVLKMNATEVKKTTTLGLINDAFVSNNLCNFKSELSISKNDHDLIKSKFKDIRKNYFLRSLNE